MIDENDVLKDTFESIIFAVTGVSYKVCFRTMESLAFTDGNTITINSGSNSMISKLNKEQQKLFKAGLFAHEMMHCIKTDFNYLKEFSAKYKLDQRFHNIHNIVEDAAIENFAKEFFGQWLLDSISFMNRVIYKDSQTIEELPDTYSQWQAACLQYGWCRSLKNKFSNDEAEELYKKTFTLYMQIINEPDNQKRVDLTYELYQELLTACPLPESGQTHMADSLCDNSGTPDVNIDQIIKNIQSMIESDVPICQIVAMSKSDETGEAEPDFETDELPDIDILSEEMSEKFETALEILKELSDKVQNKMKENAKREKKAQKETEKPLEYRCEKYGTDNDIIMCNNRGDEAKYQEIVHKHNGEINALEKSFKKILAREKEAVIHHKSGKFNTERFYTKGYQTVKFFDKRKAEKDAYDSSICLLVDESYSMFSKMNQCREQVVILTEVLFRLKIPFSVIGFSADERVIDVPVHRIYVNWNPAQRNCVTKLDAREQNFDGYSVKYAGEVLKKRTSKNKLLIVLSDGEPSCNMYSEKVNGVTDTKQAISDVKKYCDIIGIAMGRFNKRELNNLHTMYGGDFIYSQNISEIVQKLAPKLKKILKEW